MTVQAIIGSQKVTYIDYGTNRTLTLEGGSPAWRNNNPGNLRDGDLARNNGAIGSDSNGFAIFPDPQTGAAALAASVNGYSSRGASIDSMMAAYAPSFENNTSAYQAFLASTVGVSGSTLIKNLTADQLASLIKGIVKYEGTIPGAATYKTISASTQTLFSIVPEPIFYINSSATARSIEIIVSDPISINLDMPSTGGVETSVDTGGGGGGGGSGGWGTSPGGNPDPTQPGDDEEEENLVAPAVLQTSSSSSGASAISRLADSLNGAMASFVMKEGDASSSSEYQPIFGGSPLVVPAH